ncbi:MAG TPA: hypothetical protein VHS31_13810 [Tepidisphaeraceae bacterium]|nr:hypothetical protein [Tepidisphaeraceae bacterium]
MQTAKDCLEHQFPQMRAWCLSLAADLDRIERSEGGQALLESNPSVQQLRRAIKIILDERTNRAEQIQMLFSDTTPAPNPQSKIQNPKMR